jgi:ubiquitin-conjugating enzyme E2 J2
MATQTAVMRLTRDYKAILKSPIPFIETHPLAADILVWPYVVTGPPNTPYVGGQYFGYLAFPADFPYSAPKIMMLTPSGRFAPRSSICTTFTNMHPEEWNPAWTVEGILTGFLSYMTGDEYGAGSYHPTTHREQYANRPKYAQESKRWNAMECDGFARNFPELHQANIKSENFTEDELKGIYNAIEKRKLQERKSETEKGNNTAVTAVSGLEEWSDTSYETFVNEDWEKYGSMEDDYDPYEDDEDDEDYEDYEDYEDADEMEEDEDETLDTKMGAQEKV